MNRRNLIDSLAALSAPSRELDAHIYCYLHGFQFVLIAAGGERYGDICDPLDSGFGGASLCTSGNLYARLPEEKRGVLGGGVLGNRVQGCGSAFPRFTESIDAAARLVPAKLPRNMRPGTWWWTVETLGPSAHVAYENRDAGIIEHTGEGATAAISLCIAALKADLEAFPDG